MRAIKILKEGSSINTDLLFKDSDTETLELHNTYYKSITILKISSDHITVVSEDIIYPYKVDSNSSFKIKVKTKGASRTKQPFNIDVEWI